MRQKVVERVTGLITELWPSSKVYSYDAGSNILSFFTMAELTEDTKCESCLTQQTLDAD